MEKITPRRLLRLDPLDCMVVLTLVIVPLSYYLGFSLDWSEQSQGLPLAQAEAQIAASAMGPESSFATATASAVSRANADEEGPSAWQEMTRRLEAEAITYPGRVAIYIKDLKHDRAWGYRADDLFPSASLVKVPLMVAIFDKIHSGEISLDTSLRMHRSDRVGGSGRIKWYPDGTSFSVRTLLGHMIDESDNTAAHMLIEATGFNYLQQEFPRLGLAYTEIYPEGLSLRSSGVRYENYTTARDMSMLLEKIYRGEVVDPGASKLMIEYLKRHHVRARLAKRLPIGWEIAHKTGLLRGACHDTAIIFTPSGDYILTVLTGQNRSYGLAKDFITRLGRITYQYYKTPDQLFASLANGQHPLY